MHPKRIMTHPSGSIRQTSHGPRPPKPATQVERGKVTFTQGVSMGAEEVEGPGGLGGGIQDGFLEEVSVGISEQFTSFLR